MSTKYDDKLRADLTGVLGMSLDTSDPELVRAVNDLVQLRQRIESNAATEQRIAELQGVTHCTRETALSILAAQKAAGA
jgi:hypothetical protein